MTKGAMRRRFWRISGVAAIGVIVVLAAACGSDGERTSVSSEKPGISASDGPNNDSFVVGGEAYAQDGAKPSGSLAPASVSGANGGSGTGTLPSLLDRKIIRTATVSIEAEQVSARFEDVGNIAASFGGFVSSSSFGNAGDVQTASVTVRVPAERYQDVLTQLRKLGTVKGEQSNASDVTEEFTDLESRARNLKATEAQYLEFLTRAGDLNEVLLVQDRLNGVRAEIEQVQGRIQLIAAQADLATITVHLAPPVVAKDAPKDGGAGNPLEVAQEAFEASLVVLVGAATVALAAVAFSWWLLPVGAVVYYFVRKQTNERRRNEA